MDHENEYREQFERVRPVTRRLIEALVSNSWPPPPVIVDFGIDSQRHFEALRFAVCRDEIMPATLDRALGDGRMLTEITRAAASNPHKDIEFYTSWDVLRGVERPEKANKDYNELLDAVGRTFPPEIDRGPER